MSINFSLSFLLQYLFDILVQYCFTSVLINECNTYQITVNQDYLTNTKLTSVQHMFKHNTFTMLYESLAIILFHSLDVFNITAYSFDEYTLVEKNVLPTVEL